MGLGLGLGLHVGQLTSEESTPPKTATEGLKARCEAK